MNSDRQKALFAIIFAAVTGGAGPVFTKIVIQTLPPVSYNLIRFTIGFVSILPILFIQRKSFKKVSFSVILITLFATGNVVLFAIGISHTQAVIAQMLYASVPILTAVLSFIFLGERLSLQKKIGLLIGFVGVLEIINFRSFIDNGHIEGQLLGNVIIFFAALSYALYQVTSKHSQKKYPPLQMTTLFIVMTIVSQLGLFAIEKQNVKWIENITPTIIILMLYIGTVCTSIYYLLNQYAIKHGTPTIASLTLYLQPVSTFFWAKLLLGEKLTFDFILGSSLIFVGVYFISLKSGKNTSLQKNLP